MTDVGTVSITMVRVLVAASERAGVQRSRVFAAAELDPGRLEDTAARLSLAEFERLLQVAVELSGDEALGLHVGAHLTSAAFELLGHLSEHAATLRQLIDTIARYASIVMPGPVPELSESGDVALVRYAFAAHDSLAMRFAAELALSGLVRAIRQYIAPDARARGVYFAYEAPSYRAEYARIFDGAEDFGHPFTGIEFERAWLDRPQLHDNAELYTLLQSQAERELVRRAREATFADRVTECLLTPRARSVRTTHAIARELGMSARSLRRRLQAEGVLYKELIERVWIARAKHMLESPRSSIQEIAYDMGFSSSATFHRAFKRWTGMTPKKYRESR